MVAVPLAGAEQRLLHPSVPVAFFGLATLAHLGFWLLLAWLPERAAVIGGPGPGLAAVHMLTVGVLAAAAVGAVLQILPVTTMQTAPPLWAGWALLVLIGGGGTLLVAAFLTISVAGMIAGATALGLGLLLFTGLLGRLLWKGRAAGLPDTLPAILGAAVALAGVVALAVLLAADYRLAWLPDHGAAAAAHLVLAGYGFMGLLVVGFSHILVPMLAVAEPPKPRAGRPALVLAVCAVAAAAAGLLGGSVFLTALGGVAGLVASVLHVDTMVRAHARRMRKRLGPSFVLIRVSWLLLPLSIAAGLGALAGIMPPLVFGVLLLPGWLLTILLGMLQRILPFLASMNTVRRCARPASATALVWDAPLKVLAVLHPAAVALLTLAAALDAPLLTRMAGVVGMAGAIAFLIHALTVGVRALRHRRRVGPKPKPARPGGTAATAA
ncbi:hypothetical protein C882_1439 [Caenispirillum salinarum AK4]|uniref:Transmembrane protein n=2 Tax=Caenispirillum TaxID=414051 RepID=K9HAJ4_9PROT|nr:hypothetical protein C882_1439 [Caenispirillum salinarum AK4]